MAPTVPIDFVGQKESKKGWLSQPMGKSWKHSQGHPSSFVPDYQHVVETMGESEGFGSSGRVDAEMTASEDSCAPKRKCINLNTDGYDSLIPMQVLSLSKMSRSERKDLKLRLKFELEQIRALQKRMASLSTQSDVLSPSSDIRSCSDGQKRPPLENLNRSSEASVPHTKKRAPPGRNGSKTKKGTSARIEQTKPAAPVSTSNAMLMKQCESLLKRLMTHQYGYIFNEPVDPVKLNIPDYFTVIKHPMDFGTMKSKFASGHYSNPIGFAADVRLTFSNALKYNPPGNHVHVMAETLSKYFEVRWKAIEKKLPLVTDVESVPPATGARVETIEEMPPSKKKKTLQCDKERISEAVRHDMTTEQKHKLSTELENLLGELPENIIDFLKEHCYGADQTGEDEIEIDIDALSNDTLFKLRKLLDDFLIQKQKNQGKGEPCEMELPNESGFSNSSLQPCKGNGPADEDVDIVGGNDPPISSYPPAEKKEEAGCKNSKCSSSSSSSSGSGSSSSDSDSGTSSGSDLDVAKTSVPSQPTEDKVGAVEIDEQKRNDLGDLDLGKQSINWLPQDFVNSQCKPIDMEIDDHQDGESAPTERQVSPEKLYRAALLKNRFADTILKAREKALEKGDKRDPEKLRMEREELERRQKEEKARLQAEAKAAEEARRKAAAAAAAEARKKRELEREAARQALLEMEKSVDINENSRFMEDFEMFRTAQNEQAPSFMEETSSDHSPNGLGSFKLQGTNNPLEQLGLYMKADDEEEEEEEEVGPVHSVPDSAKDVEEGEID
ncbi:hypothetical protein K2173_001059 [Erythroxylum novogranatense]|uniref:Uncharacterized protein n=1 Tax=Erythroxylum novogranatense TaxID=1862640 RepID=A0AAV8SJ02_9ROSI|nr:hypothetical protein K2173_001059 [Erythroxylum novogranatense]